MLRKRIIRGIAKTAKTEVWLDYLIKQSEIKIKKEAISTFNYVL
jgi:hypothetical protein